MVAERDVAAAYSGGRKTNQLPEFLIQRRPNVPHMFIAKQSLFFFYSFEETISILNFRGLYSLPLCVHVGNLVTASMAQLAAR